MFTVSQDYRLSFDHYSHDYQSLCWTRIRVVGRLGRQYAVDPLVSQSEAHAWRLWIWEGRALHQLS